MKGEIETSHPGLQKPAAVEELPDPRAPLPVAGAERPGQRCRSLRASRGRGGPAAPAGARQSPAKRRAEPPEVPPPGQGAPPGPARPGPAALQPSPGQPSPAEPAAPRARPLPRGARPGPAMERRQDSGDSISERQEWRPVTYRKCTDTLWLLLFCLFWAGLMFISGYAVVAGAAERLVLGYDSFGNICGRKNTPVEGANLSGLDMTNKKYVFFLNSCSLEIQSLKISSLSLCVSSCPQQQLNSLEDLQSFARNNGSFLCVYNLNVSSYTLNPKAAQLCPTLPVPPSKSFPLFNRCVPQNPECYSKYSSVLISMVNEMDVFHRILSGILAGRDTVIGLSVLALAFSLVLVLAFRFIQTVLVHTLIALVVFGLLFVSGVLWWLHYDYRNDPSTELETEKENVKFLLGYAIFSTIVTVILLSLIFVLRKRLQFAVQLFRIVGKIIGRIPFLLFQPLWTFLILIVFWVFWVAVLLSLGTAGTAQSTSGGQVEYRALSGICYMAWYHFIGLIWTSEFILACQQMVIAGAVVTCYFNRNCCKRLISNHNTENTKDCSPVPLQYSKPKEECKAPVQLLLLLGLLPEKLPKMLQPDEKQVLEEVTLVPERKLLSSQAESPKCSTMLSESTFQAAVPSRMWDVILTSVVARIPEVTHSLQAQLSFVEFSWK
ncbi:choline transporter-like protein 3 isoform X6 [Prinia subflava]|uniref:choline transporter-like protein 3 isoform X6 n=1 Tax=Prinia subflava TaxID=208062 RepID=UPI002FE28004